MIQPDEDLPDLVERFAAAGTKCYGSSYARNYTFHFRHRRSEPLLLLEIGIGGYDRPDTGGESLQIWQDFFPAGRIVGIDIAPKTGLENERVRVFQGDQRDANFLRAVVDEVGPPDIVIDDGSHRNQDVLATFRTLFPLLGSNAIYVVEDVQFSYFPNLDLPSRDEATHPFWTSYGGALAVDSRGTMMSFFKRLADGLNYRDFINPGYRPSALEETVTSVAFYRGQVFVTKGDNTAPGHLCDHNSIRSEWLETMGVESMAALGLRFPQIRRPEDC